MPHQQNVRHNYKINITIKSIKIYGVFQIFVNDTNKNKCLHDEIKCRWNLGMLAGTRFRILSFNLLCKSVMKACNANVSPVPLYRLEIASSFYRFFASAVPKKVFGIWRMYRSLRKLNNFYNIQILFRYSNKVCVIGWAFGTHHRKYEVWVQVFLWGGGIWRKQIFGRSRIG